MFSTPLAVLLNGIPTFIALLRKGAFLTMGFGVSLSISTIPFFASSFQTALLNENGKHIGPSFKKTKALIYKKDAHGFYVYAKPNFPTSQTVVKYISRYLGRPVIA